MLTLAVEIRDGVLGRNVLLPEETDSERGMVGWGDLERTVIQIHSGSPFPE